MISKAKIKLIKSLDSKKARRAEGLFVAEGPKVVTDLLQSFRPYIIVCTQQWHDNNLSQISSSDAEIIIVSEEELHKVSFLKNPQQVLAVFQIEGRSINNASIDESIILALDEVQDPGNLGTIIRIADWFGIERIICSMDCADCYNPKVVQATMGSLSRVSIEYTSLKDYLGTVPEGTKIYGTFLDGNDITECKSVNKAEKSIIIMGNEGNGISKEIEQYVNHRILIPNYPKGRATADSLNVAIATAITCYHFRNLSSNI